VRSVHREYVAAGADVITTNNFVCTPHSLSKIGKADTGDELIEAAGRLAREVADQASRPVQVAGG
jgi:methionine synthase I (cobalamin-dependent)